MTAPKDDYQYAVTVNDLYVAYKEPFSGTRHQVVSGLSFSVRRGSIFGIVGPTGCGKTTVALAIIGAIQPQGGYIGLFDNAISPLNPSDRAAIPRYVQYVPQNPHDTLPPYLSVHEVIKQVLLSHGIYGPGGKDTIEWGLHVVDLPGNLLSRLCGTLSVGQKQRVALLRSLLLKPEIIICDEVTSGLDSCTELYLMDLILQVRSKINVTVLVISHSKRLIKNLCEGAIYVRSNGKGQN